MADIKQAAKWSPGPWLFERQEIYEQSAKLTGKSLAEHEGFFRDNDGAWAIVGPDESGRVAVATFKGKAKRGAAWNAPDPEGQANARLIAAAPELYAALEKAVTGLEAAGFGCEYAKAALRKARGEQ